LLYEVPWSYRKWIYGECILFFIQFQLNIDKYFQLWNSTNLRNLVFRYSSFQPVIYNLQYARSVKPSFEEFILPSKKYADVIIPRGGDNDVAIDLIIQHIRAKLGQHHLCKIYPNVSVIHSTFQVILFNLIYCCNFFSNSPATLLFVMKFCMNQISWLEISILGYERKQIIIFSSAFHPDAGNAHTRTWCQDNEAWLCLLCRPTNTLGRYLSIKRNFRDINWVFFINTTSFVFGSMSQVVEHGLGHLPFTEKQITTPTGNFGCIICSKFLWHIHTSSHPWF